MIIDTIREIIELQANWSAGNTPKMQRRGVLIRDTLPAEIASFRDEIAIDSGLAADDIGFEGRDGSGRKTAIPWTRIHSIERSPTPRHGWYVVLLFPPSADRVYLCLMYAATVWTGADFKPKPESEVRPLIDWCRGLLAPYFFSEPKLLSEISLGKKGKLGKPYEDSTACAIKYDLSDLPSSADLKSDIKLFSVMLGKIYRAQSFGLTPNAAEEMLASSQTELSALLDGRSKGNAQGFLLNAQERRVIELHAMDLARKHLVKEGYHCTDTSASLPYDFLARKATSSIVVEVKGTTSRGASIFLTANELEIHKASHPDNCLIVVHSIELHRENGGACHATGGVLVEHRSWDVGAVAIKPLAYQITL